MTFDRQFSRLSTRTKLTLVFVACFAVLTALFAYNAFDRRRIAIADATAEAERAAALFEREGEDIQGDMRHFLELLATRPAVRARDWSACDAVLESMPPSFPQYSSFVVADLSGNVVCNDSPRQRNSVETTWMDVFGRTIQARSFVIGDIAKEPFKGGTTVMAGAPVFAEDRSIVGAVGLAFDFRWLERRIAASPFSHRFQTDVVDRRGTVLAHVGTNQRPAGVRLPPSVVGQSSERRFRGSFEAAGGNGVARLYSVTPLWEQDGRGIYAFVSIRKSVLLAPAERAFALNITLVAGILLILGGIVMVTIRQTFYTPIGRLLAATRSHAAGHSSVSFGPPYPGGEMGELAASFDQMSCALAEREAQLSALSRTLRDAIESLNDGFALYDRADRLVMCNPKYRQLFARCDHLLVPGARFEDLVRADAAMGVSPDARGREEEWVQERLARRRAGEDRVLRPMDGRWVLYRDTRTADGSIVCVRTDITALKLREIELSDALGRFQDYANIAADWFWELDAGLRTSFLSQKEGWDDASRRLGRPFKEIVEESVEPATISSLLADLDARRPFRDLRIKRKTTAGENRVLTLVGKPRCDADGVFLGYRGTARDITDEVRAGEELRRREEAFRTIAELAPVGICRRDADGKVIYVNQRWSVITGLAFDDSLGDGWIKALHPDDHERVILEWAIALRSGKAFTSEYRCGRPDGTVSWVLGQFRPELNAQGDLVGFLGSVSDLTLQKEAESRQRQAQKLEALGQLTGAIAHDFNNLLTVMLGNLEQITATLVADDETVHRYVMNARRAALRGATLTQRLLSFASREGLKLEIVDLSRVVHEFSDSIRQAIRPNIELALHPGAEIDFVRLDPDHFAEALLNIAVNAADAMPERGRLSIEIKQIDIHDDPKDGAVPPGHYIRIRAADTGIGMSAEVLGRAIEPFYTTKKRGHGTGLGLSIVHGFVQQSGGHLIINSVVGQGTCVDIYLPRAYAPAAVRHAPLESEHPNDGARTILLVDDDADVRDTLAQMLIGMGNKVLSVDGPLAALSLLDGGEPIDVLLTDVMLEDGVNGVELAEAARRRHPDLAILFISGYIGRAADGVPELPPWATLVEKPVTSQTLSDKVREAFASRSHFSS